MSMIYYKKNIELNEEIENEENIEKLLLKQIYIMKTKIHYKEIKYKSKIKKFYCMKCKKVFSALGKNNLDFKNEKFGKMCKDGENFICKKCCFKQKIL